MLGVSPADPSLQQCWEFMNPKTSWGEEISDLYCRDKWVPSASPGANGLPRLQVATCPKVTWWLWKEGEKAFPTDGWAWSGFPSLAVWERSHPHPELTPGIREWQMPAAFQDDPCSRAGGGHFSQGTGISWSSHQTCSQHWDFWMKLQLEAAEHVLQGRNRGGGREGEAWDVSGHIPGRYLLGEATPGWLFTAKFSRILTFLLL